MSQPFWLSGRGSACRPLIPMCGTIPGKPWALPRELAWSLACSWAAARNSTAMATPYGSEAGSSPGLLQSFKAYVATWVELLKTRVELLTTELQEERERTEQIVF